MLAGASRPADPARAPSSTVVIGIENANYPEAFDYVLDNWGPFAWDVPISASFSALWHTSETVFRIGQVPKAGWSAPSVHCWDFEGTTYNPEPITIDFNGMQIPGVAVTGIPQVAYCTFSNYLVRELVIEKQFGQVAPEIHIPDLDDVPELAGLPPQANLLSEGFTDEVTYQWRYEVPAAWSGTISETSKPGWFPIEGYSSCEVEPSTDPFACTFINEFGRIILAWQLYTTINGEPSKAFKLNLPAGSLVLPFGSMTPFGDDTWSQWANLVVPPEWDGTITATPPAGWSGMVTSCTPGALNTCVFQAMETGKVRVETWEDTNHNGIVDAADTPLPNATLYESGIDGNETRHTNANGVYETPEFTWAGAEGTYEFVTPAGWVALGSAVDGAWDTAMLREVTVPSAGVAVVQFLARPATVDITAAAVIYNNANPAGGNGGEGWQFTLTGCGIDPLAGITDETGRATWTLLPSAIDCEYTVTAAGRDGWLLDIPARKAAPTEDGTNTTLAFVARQLEGCTNIAECGPVSAGASPTAVPPSATPTAPPTTSPPSGEPESSGRRI